MLGDSDRGLGQFGDLVATDRPSRRKPSERPAALRAALWQVLDHLGHPLDRQEPAARAGMTGLGAGLSTRAPALMSILAGARIDGRRKRRVIRATAQLPNLSLQPLDPPLQPLHLASQSQQNLHASTAPRVIDRLRLSTLHTETFDTIGLCPPTH